MSKAVDIADVTNQASFRNLIINGDFRVNQRGAASRTENTNAYNYDRWYYDGTNLYQVIEDLNIVNGDYTISWSGSGLTAGWVISSNTTSSIPASFNTVTSGSSFTVSGKTTGDHLWIRFNGTLANLADVQVEAGTVATPFERRPYGTELALCQRYYQKYSGLGLVFYGYWDATNTAVLGFNYPVTPRIPPTGIIVSSASHFFINNSAVGNPTANAIAFGSSSASTLDLSATVASGGACCGKSCKMISNNTSAFIELTGVEL